MKLSYWFGGGRSRR